MVRSFKMLETDFRPADDVKAKVKRYSRPLDKVDRHHFYWQFRVRDKGAGLHQEWEEDRTMEW